MRTALHRISCGVSLQPLRQQVGGAFVFSELFCLSSKAVRRMNNVLCLEGILSLFGLMRHEWSNHLKRFKKLAKWLHSLERVIHCRLWPSSISDKPRLNLHSGLWICFECCWNHVRSERIVVFARRCFARRTDWHKNPHCPSRWAQPCWNFAKFRPVRQFDIRGHLRARYTSRYHFVSIFYIGDPFDGVIALVSSDKYCDIPLGLFLVRGDNLILLGEVDEEKEASQKLEKVSPAELTELLAAGDAPKLEWDFE